MFVCLLVGLETRSVCLFTGRTGDIVFVHLLVGLETRSVCLLTSSTGER